MPIKKEVKILPSITTTSRRHGWLAKVKEIRQAGLDRIALFPTAISPDERQELYRELEDSPVERIPFVHLRSDMDVEEINYLIGRFGMEKCNIHPHKRHAQHFDISYHNHRIYVENMYEHELEESDLEGRAGICLDVSHLEDCRSRCPEMYRHVTSRLQGYPCGCWHVSAIRRRDSDGPYASAVSLHRFQELSDFDYLTDYRQYLPDTLAMEVENPISEQLEAIAYIYRILG